MPANYALSLTAEDVGPGGNFNPYDVIPEIYGNYSGNQDNDARNYAEQLGFLNPTSEDGEFLSDNEIQALRDYRAPIDDLDEAAFWHDVNAINIGAEHSGFSSILPHVANDLEFAGASLMAGIGGFFSELGAGNFMGAIYSLGMGVSHAIAGVAFSFGHAALGLVTGFASVTFDIASGIGDALGGIGSAIGGFISGLFGGGGEGEGDGEGDGGGSTDASFYGSSDPFGNPLGDPFGDPFGNPYGNPLHDPYVFTGVGNDYGLS